MELINNKIVAEPSDPWGREMIFQVENVHHRLIKIKRHFADESILRLFGEKRCFFELKTFR